MEQEVFGIVKGTSFYLSVSVSVRVFLFFSGAYECGSIRLLPIFFPLPLLLPSFLPSFLPHYVSIDHSKVNSFALILFCHSLPLLTTFSPINPLQSLPLVISLINTVLYSNPLSLSLIHSALPSSILSYSTLFYPILLSPVLSCPLQANDCDLDAQEGWLLRRQVKLEGGFQGRTNKLVDSCYSFWQVRHTLGGWGVVECSGVESVRYTQRWGGVG